MSSPSMNMRILAAALVFCPPKPARAQDGLPIDAAAVASRKELPAYSIRNLLSREQIISAFSGGEKGLELDFGRAATLLDGTAVQPSAVYGTAYFGPYPFAAAQAAYAYKRFRGEAKISEGRGLLKVGKLLGGSQNSEGWKDSGEVAVRLELFLAQPGADRSLGAYDTFAAFRLKDGRFELLPAVIEGPLLCRTDSRRPGEATIAFATDRDVPASVHAAGKTFDSPPGRRHEVRLSGLPPGRQGYRVEVAGRLGPAIPFDPPPAPGKGPVTFAFLGDSRQGYGGGQNSFMGTNPADMERLAALAYAQGAGFLVVGGDFIDGFSVSREDMLVQYWGAKQALAGFWRRRAVFPVMGNHEASIKALASPGRWATGVDRWPYETSSSEAIFAEAFAAPQDAPAAADPRMPAYKGSVYTVQHGDVRLIVFNNDHWHSDDPKALGGSPGGYILEDQLAWIESEVKAADLDRTVGFIFLAAHTPAFPCGGHVGEAMWRDGDNNVRAHVFRAGKLQPEKLGMVEVRNRLARIAASSLKVAAVLGSDEHSYTRLLVDKDTPAGEPSVDDRDGDGRIDWKSSEPATPLKGLAHPVWYLISGGGGAPYYSEDRAPWSDHWKKRKDPSAGYRFSAQEHLILLRTQGRKASLTVLNQFGEKIDEVPDLMAVKR